MGEKFLQEEKLKDDGSLRLATSRSTVNTSDDFRLRKSEIIRGYQSFGRIFAGGNSITSKSVRCYYSADSQIPPFSLKVGFAVKKAKNAAARNRLKRLLRESFRLHRQALKNLCITTNTRIELVLLIDTKKTPAKSSLKDIDPLVMDILSRLIQVLSDKWVNTWSMCLYLLFDCINRLYPHFSHLRAVIIQPVLHTRSKRFGNMARLRAVGWASRGYWDAIRGIKADTIRFHKPLIIK